MKPLMMRAQVHEARAAFASKHTAANQARLDDARAQVRRAEEKFAAADAALAKMQKDHDKAREELQRYNLALITIEGDLAKANAEIPAIMPSSDVDAPEAAGRALWEQRHERVAANFCKILLRIKQEGARRFQDSMWSLWQAAEALHPLTGGEDIDLSTGALQSYYHVVADIRPMSARKGQISQVKSPYGHVSQRWLLSFEAMARQLKDEHALILEENGAQAAALTRMVSGLSTVLDNPGVRTMRSRNTASKMSVFGLSRDTTTVPEQLDQFSSAWAVLPLIWLPMSLYVRSTTHLYEMLDRLHAMCKLPAASSQGANAEDELRAVLDRDQRRYSYLVYSITAALQTVILAKAEMGKRFPYPLLASSPPDPGKEQKNGYPFTWCDSWSGVQPIFRGIWVGDHVDEERAMCQYSFQSFSRQMDGVAQVLSFYASVTGSPTAKLATKHKHVLILVARQRYMSDECFALPVQLVDGPRAEKSELEVLLPPFVRYEFDDELQISSADFDGSCATSTATAKLKELRARWRGFEVPDLLMSLLKREDVADEFPEIRALRPFVTVRFVSKVTLASPMQKLFSGSGACLYNFGDAS